MKPWKKYLIISALMVIFCSPNNILAYILASGEIVILSHTGYVDPSGNYRVVGEVQNIGSSTIDYVQVTATFYDSNDVIIDTRFDLTMLYVLLPSRKSPFEISLLDAAESAGVHHYSLDVTFTESTPLPQRLKILSNSSHIDVDGQMHVVGELKNLGDEALINAKVIATCYDAAEKVIAVAAMYFDPELTGEIYPDQVEEFEITLNEERTPLVESYKLTAESNQYAIASETAPKLSDFSSLFVENHVRMIYPSESSSKPLGCSPAMVSDWTASAFIYTKLEDVSEGLDLDPGFVDQATGQAIGDPEIGIITFGGPVVNPVVRYAELDSTSIAYRAPIRFHDEGGVFYFQHWDGEGIPGASLPISVINGDQDMFVIEVFNDGSARNVMICYGFGWKGSYASGKYFDRLMYPHLESYPYTWMIVMWEDTNGNGFIDAPNNGDDYTIIATGS